MHTVKKIIIIDDDDTTCFLNKNFLEEMQVTEDIECFLDAQKALEFIQEAC